MIQKQYETEVGIRDTISDILRSCFYWFDQNDQLIVQCSGRGVRVVYVSARASQCSDDTTRVEYRFGVDSKQFWIGSIQVAQSHRFQGIGSQLVKAAEEFARAVGSEVINVLPIPSALAFWVKMGYSKHPRIARVLHKRVL